MISEIRCGVQASAFYQNKTCCSRGPDGPRRPHGRNQRAFCPPVGGLCPRAAIKCVHIVRRPPPGSGYCLSKGSKEFVSTRLTRLTRMAGRWKGVLGA